MKIEIAENLVYTYLKHSEGCRIVQTNWKTSGQWTTTEYDEKQARDLFEKVKASPKLSGIFKDSSFDQLIKQAEIDVLGLNTTEQSVFGIDVAFHSGGLNYGSAEKTANVVMKKVFRTIFIMQSYFSGFDKFHSYFVTPKVYQATENPILELLEEAKSLIDDEMISIDFIANDNFYSAIVDPAINCVSEENDTAELFSRAVKLLQLDKRKIITEAIPVNQTKELVNKKVRLGSEKRTQEGMKIGQFVQYKMRHLYEQNLLSEEEIINLQNKEYTKRVFNQDFEILRSADRNITDDYGRTRYYSRHRFCGSYYMTSQWFERNWEPFLSWLRKIEKRSLAEKV